MSHVSGRETRYLRALLWVSGSSRPSREEGLGLETGVGRGVSVASRNQVTARSGHHSRGRQAHAALSPGGRRCSPTCAGTPGAKGGWPLSARRGSGDGVGVRQRKPCSVRSWRGTFWGAGSQKAIGDKWEAGSGHSGNALGPAGFLGPKLGGRVGDSALRLTAQPPGWKQTPETTLLGTSRPYSTMDGPEHSSDRLSMSQDPGTGQTRPLARGQASRSPGLALLVPI